MDALVVATLPQWQRHERVEYRPTAAEVYTAWTIPLDALYFIIRVARGKVDRYSFISKMIFDMMPNGEQYMRMVSIVAKDYWKMTMTIPRSIIQQVYTSFFEPSPHDSAIIASILARYRSLFDDLDAYGEALGFIGHLVGLGEYIDVEFATYYASMDPLSVDSIMKDIDFAALSEIAIRVLTTELSNSIFVLHHAARGLSFMIRAHPQSDKSKLATVTITRLNLIELLQDAYMHSFPKNYEFPHHGEVLGLLWGRYVWFDEDTFNRTMVLMSRLNSLPDSVVLEIVAYMTSRTMYKSLFLSNLDRIVSPWRPVTGLHPPLLRLVYLARTTVTSLALIPSRYTKIRRMESEESDLSGLVNAMRRAHLIGVPGLRVEAQLATLQKLVPYVVVEHILAHYELIPSKKSPLGVFGRFKRDPTRSVWAMFRSIHLTSDAGGYFLSTKQLYSLRGKAKHTRRLFEDPLPMLTHLVITDKKFRYINPLLENYILVNKEGALKYLRIRNEKVTSAPPRAWIEFITLTKIERLKLSGPGGMGLVYHIPKGNFPEFLHLPSPPTSLLPTTDKTEIHIQQELRWNGVRQRKQKIYMTTGEDIEQPLEDIVTLHHTTSIDLAHRVTFPNLKILHTTNLHSGEDGVLIAPELTKLSCTFRTWAMDVFVVPKLRHLSIFFPRAIRATRETLKYPPTLTSLTLRGKMKPSFWTIHITLPELTRFSWNRIKQINEDVTHYSFPIRLDVNMPKLQKLVLLAPKYRRRVTTTIPYYRIKLIHPTPLLKTIVLRGLNELICKRPLPKLLDIYCIHGSKLTFPTAFVSTKLRTVVQIHAAIEVPKRSERRYAIALECTNDMTCSDTAYPSPPHAVKATPAMVDKLDKIVIGM